MSSEFISLIFGFCAWIAAPDDSLLFGYRVQDKCIGISELEGDNPHSENGTFVADGHTINWEWLDGCAEVAIDGQRFVITKIIQA